MSVAAVHVAPSIDARAGTEADAILGVLPKEVFTPGTLDDAAAILGALAREKRHVAFVGGGTGLGLGSAPRALDAIVRTERLSRIVEHAPSDQVVVVEAGMTLSDLQKTVAAHGQRLALDPPHEGAATIGGLVATNAFGPSRTRFGSIRDLIIGISFVRADGILARGGGKVVKNVAGFDLPKMMVGSLGTLGLMATAAFRLHPLPEVETTLLLPQRTAGDVRALVVALRDAQLEPSAVFAILSGSRYDVAVRFSGFRAGVVAQEGRLRALVAKTSGGACDVLSEAEARALWERHDALRTTGPLRAKIAMLPSSFEEFFEGPFPTLRAAVSEAALAVYPTLGISFFSGTPAAAAAAAAAIASVRAFLASAGGSLVLEEAPADVRARVDVWGPPPQSIALMRRLKDRLDPEGRLNPGRFVGGI